MDIPDRILSLCKIHNISPNRLATLADMPYSTLQDIVSRRNQNTQVSTIEKICAGLGISLADFFSDNPPVDLPPEAVKELQIFTEFLHYKYKKPPM